MVSDDAEATADGDRVDGAGPPADDAGSPADRAGPFVRPFGHVAAEPVVRRVGDRDVFVGNRHAATRAAPDTAFRHVLSLTREPAESTTHHRPIRDGPAATWTEFAAAADTARRLRRRDGPLLVHCAAGISRSSAVVATALAADEDRGFRDALAAVQAARPHAVPHPALHQLGVVYLAARA